jgi:hypothetical protein
METARKFQGKLAEQSTTANGNTLLRYEGVSKNSFGIEEPTIVWVLASPEVEAPKEVTGLIRKDADGFWKPA